MPVCARHDYSIRCDHCDREWASCPPDRVGDELEEAARYGWHFSNRFSPIVTGTVCVCPQCREERSASE